MINPFQFARLPLIFFGCGIRSDLPLIIRRFGPKIILLTRGPSFLKTNEGRNLVTALDEKCITSLHMVIESEPSPEIIDDAVKRSAGFNPEAVVAIGGGSIMDAGKAISAMIPVKGNIADYLEGVGTKEHPGNKIPFIAVPTTSGTGSEATKNAVISRIGKDGFKKSLRHDNFVPDIALVDPELTLSCPAELTAASGMDCFTQLTEAYMSIRSNEYTEALALEGLKAVKSSLLRSFTDGSDIDARTGMSFAALTSGICLANAGLGAVHGFASSIGGMFSIPHGIICGTLMAAANEVTVRKLRSTTGNENALRKYARLGKIFVDDEVPDDDNYIDSFIGYLNKMTIKLNLPGLKSSGVKEAALRTISASTDVKNNPVKLDEKDLMEILSKRFT
jgi:alcohol dehydrogenase class IV